MRQTQMVLARADLGGRRGLVAHERITLLEAAVGGAGVVASDIPAHREFLDESAALLVAGEDAEAVADGAVAAALRAIPAQWWNR